MLAVTFLVLVVLIFVGFICYKCERALDHTKHQVGHEDVREEEDEEEKNEGREEEEEKNEEGNEEEEKEAEEKLPFSESALFLEPP